MARFEKSTNVDMKIYTRVKNVQDSINNSLIESVMLRGVKRANVKIETEDLGTGGCCPQMKVTAYANIGKRTPKIKVDDQAIGNKE